MRTITRSNKNVTSSFGTVTHDGIQVHVASGYIDPYAVNEYKGNELHVKMSIGHWTFIEYVT